MRQQALLMTLPGTLVLAVLGIFPLLYFIYLMTHRWVLTSGLPATFVGLANFKNLFSDAKFQIALWRTIYYTASVVGLEALLGMAIALILYNSRFRVVRSLVLLPMMSTPIAVGLIWRYMYNGDIGIVNYLLSLARIHGPLWLGDQRFAIIALIIVDVWQWTPFIILILLSGLTSLPIEVNEAATVDGASAWQKYWNITLPLLSRTIFVALVFRLMDSLRMFDLIYVVTSGGPNSATELLSFYTYKVSFRFFDMGYGATLAFVTLVVISVLSTFLIRSIREQQ